MGVSQTFFQSHCLDIKNFVAAAVTVCFGTWNKRGAGVEACQLCFIQIPEGKVTYFVTGLGRRCDLESSHTAAFTYKTPKIQLRHRHFIMKAFRL